MGEGVITNIGLEFIAKNTNGVADNEFVYLALGTDPTSALATDTALGAENTINGCTEEGIYLYVKQAYVNDIIVSNNIIRGANSANGGDAAIRLYGVVGGIITNNRINDPNTNAGTGIAASTGCDYNRISGNVVTGMSGTKISSVGSHDLPVIANIATENILI